MERQEIYVRIELRVPESPELSTTAHVAELHTTESPELCTMQRIIELGDGSTITGLAHGSRHLGMSVLPQEVVPHPDSYNDMPDISASLLSKDEFEGLWQEALQKFPSF